MTVLQGEPRALDVWALDGLNARAIGLLAGPGGGKTRAEAEFFHADGVGVVAFDPAGELARLVGDTHPEAFVIQVPPGWQTAKIGKEPLLAWLARTMKAKGKVVFDLQSLYAGASEFIDPCLTMLHREGVRDLVCIFEECQLYLGEGRAGFSWEACRAVEIGRNWRWGRIIATQRPADVTKRVLERCDTLLLGRIQGYRDAEAVDSLLRLNIESKSERDAVLRGMRDLAAGNFVLRAPANPPGVNK